MVHRRYLNRMYTLYICMFHTSSRSSVATTRDKQLFLRGRVRSYGEARPSDCFLLSTLGETE